MIVAFSTSSPWTSVALIAEDGGVLWSERVLAPGKASGACLELLSSGLAAIEGQLAQATLFGADVGPGSFIGVRVGIVLAKTLAWNQGSKCVGADSFDLIELESVVALPSKKGEFFVREPGQTPYRTPIVPPGAIGFGFDDQQTTPDAARFAAILPRLRPIPPEQLMPAYLIEPSISISKKPLSRVTPG